MPAGRPTGFKRAYAQRAAEMCLAGATDAELAEEFKVSVTTIYNWKNAHPEFLEAIKSPKETADQRVEQTLYAKALNGDTTAMIFWLKNRKPKEWRDKVETEHSGSIDLGLADRLQRARKRADA